MKVKKPLEGRIVILPDKVGEKEEKKGGIIIPDSVKKQAGNNNTGEVVAISDGKRNMKNGLLIPHNVKVGDKILYSIYSGIEYEDEDEKYFIMSEDEVLAVIE